MIPNTFPTMPTECPAQGVYYDVAPTEYFRWAAWNQSTLKNFGKWDDLSRTIIPAPDKNGGGRSPAHALAELNDPSPATESQDFGTAYHRLILEPSRFLKTCIQVDDINKRTNEGKARWASLVAQYGEDCILTPEKWELFHAMARTAAADPNARKLIGAIGHTEVSVAWTDAKTGAQCKTRIDKVIAHNRHVLVDLKTARCSHWDRFQWDAADYGYDVQGAANVDGYAAATGVDPDLIDFFLIVQEKSRPFEVVVYKMPPAWIDSGRVKFYAALRLAEKCLKTNNWPGYASGRIVDLHLPDRDMAIDEAAA